MASRWARVLGLAALGVVVGLVASRGHYHEWPGQNLPSAYEHDGRVYNRGNSSPERYDASLQRLDRYDPPLNPGHDVLGLAQLCTDHADGACDTVIYLRDGKRMVGYSLSGGP